MDKKDIFKDMDDLLDGPPVKRERGRPTKYKAAFEEQVEKLAKLGATIEEIANFFDVHEDTIYDWKNTKSDFSEALTRGKDAFDSEIVENSLRHRAIGYTHKEEKVFCSEGKIVTHETTRHYPPDTNALKFWLGNRQPARWRDKQEVDLTSKGESLNNLAGLTTEELIKRASAVSNISGDE